MLTKGNEKNFLFLSRGGYKAQNYHFQIKHWKTKKYSNRLA